MYPEHLQFVYEGEGEEKKSTGVAFLHIDTIDKARKIAIFFDQYKLDAKHTFDTSSSRCIQADINQKQEHKEFPPLQRLKVSPIEGMSQEMQFCELFFNEKIGQFKIVCTGMNSDWHLIDMNKNEVVR